MYYKKKNIDILVLSIYQRLINMQLIIDLKLKITYAAHVFG